MKTKKNLLIIFLVLVFSISLFSSFNVAYANDLNNLNMYIKIDKNGNARIIQERDSYIDTGTENYLVFDNLAESEILDFTVTENGLKYENVDKWNSSLSKDEKVNREKKANKAGILYTSTGVELCWGIGEYGDKNYVLEYTITNFVKNYLDEGQAIHWQLINPNTNMPPKNVFMRIESDIANITSENSKIWIFGTDSIIEYKDNGVEVRSTSKFKSSENAIVLLVFNDEIFNTGGRINSNKEEAIKAAMEGSDYLSRGAGKKPKTKADAFFRMIGFIFVFSVMGLFFFAIARAIKIGVVGKYKRRYKGEYYREVPYKEDFTDVYYMLYKIGMVTEHSVMTAYFLKWIKEERLVPIAEETGIIFKKENVALKIMNETEPSSLEEVKFFNIILAAAGEDKILQSKELTKWLKKNPNGYEAWKDGLMSDSKDISIQKGFIELKPGFNLFKRMIKSEKGEELEKNICKFYNYLLDYTLLPEHEVFNVRLWEEWMVWAGYMGIAEKVMKEFSKLYPDLKANSNIDVATIYYVSRYSSAITRGYASYTAEAGGGGAGSFGGGGGFSGGGSGGGTR